MGNWLKTIRAKRREKQRQRLLSLIGRDIDNIARDAYNDGCYTTTRQMQAQKVLEFACLMAENEKLRELAIKQCEIHMPELRIMAEQRIPVEKVDG